MSGKDQMVESFPLIVIWLDVPYENVKTSNLAYKPQQKDATHGKLPRW